MVSSGLSSNDIDLDEIFPPMTQEEIASRVMVANSLLLSPAEYTEFVKWLHECCGYSLDDLTDSQTVDAWSRWQDELFYAENPDYLY